MLAGEQTSYGLSRKNKMPYFFAIFEDLLGLRESPSLPAAGANERETAAGGASAPAVQSVNDQSSSGRPCPEKNAPSEKPAPAPALKVGGPPAPVAGEDARLIKTVISEFSRQFADYAAAEALGGWAVTLWQQSHLPREHFLAAATEASALLLSDQAISPSAAQFQNFLMNAVEQMGRGKVIQPQDRGEASASSAPPTDGANPPS